MSTKEELHDKITQLTREHIESVAGGLSCSASEIDVIVSNLVGTYEGLVDATSHIIERVANSLQ